MRKYKKIVRWSKKDDCYVGTCRELFFGGVHGNNKRQVQRELNQVVHEWEKILERRKRKLPLIRMLEWIEKNRVRLFFSTGRVVEIALPQVKSARRAKIVDGGMGLDPGNGKDVSAPSLAYHRDAVVLVRGRRTQTRCCS